MAVSTLFRAVTIDIDGDAKAVQWDPTTSDTLRHLQQAVGGLVDAVTLHESVTMWVNDEGVLRGMPINLVASSLARDLGTTHQPYFGPIIFTGGCDDEGETLGLSEQHVEALMNLARIIQLELELV